MREVVPPTQGMKQQMKLVRQSLVGAGQHACSLLWLMVWIPAGEAVSSKNVKTWPWFLLWWWWRGGDSSCNVRAGGLDRNVTDIKVTAEVMTLDANAKLSCKNKEGTGNEKTP